MKGFTIKKRLLLNILITLLGFIFVTLLSLFFLRHSIFEEKKTQIKQQIQTAYSIIENYYNLYREGLISEEEAKENALAQIKNLRYAENNYFWINDTSYPFPKMIMHPTNPGLNGKILDDPKFNCAKKMKFGISGETIKTDGKKNLFQAMVEVVKKSKEGYVEYVWPKPLPGGKVTEEVYPKLSYVKLFEPWGWVIGTGIYIDDINSTMLEHFIKEIAIILLIVSVIIKNIVGGINGLNENFKNVVESLKKGDFSAKLYIKREDELGILVNLLNETLENIKKILFRSKSCFRGSCFFFRRAFGYYQANNRKIEISRRTKCSNSFFCRRNEYYSGRYS